MDYHNFNKHAFTITKNSIYAAVDITETYNKLVEACVAAEALLKEQMTEEEALMHELDAHDGDSCVLCQLREAIALTK